MLLHVTQGLRDRRDRAGALAALKTELEAAGTTVIESAGYDRNSDDVRISSLNRADGRSCACLELGAVDEFLGVAYGFSEGVVAEGDLLFGV
jgi:ParB family chromosome partitioning protein